MGSAVALLAGTLSFNATASAQGRTDVVTLANGDRITGEVILLERGRLEFKTDDAGTLYLEWDKLVSVVTARIVEVATAADLRFLGSLVRTVDRSIAVVTPDATFPLPMSEVTSIAPIGRSFFRKLDGSIDAGYSYTRSSGISQLNLNSTTVYRKPGFQGRLAVSLTQTTTEDDGQRDDRGTVDISYLRYPWNNWFILAAGRFERNESVGVELRSQAGAAVGPRLVNSNRAQLSFGGGLVVNDERGVEVEPDRNVEALVVFQSSYYTYDRPKTNLDIAMQYYASLSDPGRNRIQLDASVRREFFKDFFLSASVYNTFDSRPPNPDANSNDVGVVMSLGWSY